VGLVPFGFFLRHNGQTQSGALAGRLGREERLEDFVEVLGFDA